MNCPKCNKEMRIEIAEQESKLKTDEIFKRTVFYCDRCNVYVGVYMPFKK